METVRSELLFKTFDCLKLAGVDDGNRPISATPVKFAFQSVQKPTLLFFYEFWVRFAKSDIRKDISCNAWSRHGTEAKAASDDRRRPQGGIGRKWRRW